MTNLNPKSHVERKFLELFGNEIAFEVACHKEPLGWQDARCGYRTQLVVDDLIVAEAFDKSRPRSYTKLAISVEKLYVACLALV
jgi:hypothetical protein